ncbi:MAG: cell division protein SepF [Clostridia bacterium]|nr:cell division protein SepF [Clostridia bacterium]MBR3106192.1 cell division protein SepF [Clostridia bacterium]
MAFADFFNTVKNKAAQMYSNFFYDGRDVPSAPRRERAPAAQEPTPPQPSQGQQQWQNYQQPAQQQPYQQYYGGYQQQPYQQPYQQQQQSAPQPAPQSFRQQQYTQPEQPQQRFRRSAQHASNVVQVDFSSGQAQQPAQEPTQQPAGLMNARIINARGMSDCRTAITLLRNGDAVIIVMENITNPGDMRRLVDTLSGACYSLTATITKVSRYGVYLLAPQALAVFADQATNQMNAGPAHAQPQNYQANPYAAQRPVYTNPTQPAQQAPAYPPQQPYGQQQEFTQRTAAPEAAAQDFYQRPLTQEATIPSFSNRPAGVGYTPDERAAAQG